MKLRYSWLTLRLRQLLPFGDPCHLIVKSIFLVALAATTSAAYGQITYFEPYNMSDSISGGACINEIGLYVQTGASEETGGIITIDWGDGNIQTENFTGWAQDEFGFTYQHDYTLPGSYTAVISVYSGTAGDVVGSPQTVPLEAGDIASCGHILLTTYQVVPNIDYPDALYDFTGADGITTTISRNSNPMYATYDGLSPANTPYLVSINDAWLAANGLSQVSPDFTIADFDPSGMANPSPIGMEVTCNTPSAGPDFGIAYLADIPFIAAQQSGSLLIDLCNYACSDTSDVTLSLTFPAGLTPNTSGLTNPGITGNVLTFDVNALTNCTFITVPFTFPGGTPAGTAYQFTLEANNPLDANPGNNTATLYVEVMNAMDPNNKTVNAPQQIDASLPEELQYTICFQNDGNYEAFNVVVIDTLDAHLDLSTFTVLGAKHGMAVSVNPVTRVAVFTFGNIMLPPSSDGIEASQGYIVYTIKENDGLTIGDEIGNTAYIYFDFNPAIVTNTTYNINTALAVSEYAGETVVLYPNPATDAIRFGGAYVLSAKVYDLAGKLIFEAAVNGNELSVAGLPNGMYHVTVATAAGISVQKLVVSK